MSNLPTTGSTWTSQPLEPIAPRLDNAVSMVLNGVVNDGFRRAGEPPLVSRVPSQSLREAIAGRLDEVNRALVPLQKSPQERERALVAVAAMMSGWMTAKVADPEAKASAYVALLSDLPGWVVEKICKDVARGHVADLSPDFPPSAARIHQLCEVVLADIRRERERLQPARDAQPEPKASQEERERIGAGFKAAADDLHAKDAQREMAVKQRAKEIADATIARNDAEIERAWKAQGMEAPRLADGRPISIELHRLLSARPTSQAAE